MLARLVCCAAFAAHAAFASAGAAAAAQPSAEQELENARRSHLAQVESQMPLLGELVELQYRCEANAEQKRRLQSVLSAYERRLLSVFGIEMRQRYRDALVAGAQAMGQRMDAASEDRRRAACQAFLSSIEGELAAMESRLEKQPEVLP